MPALFDGVADHYDRARPSYPDGIYDALDAELDGLSGKVVVDLGAGTGIASRQLLARGAQVIALDLAEQMIRRARRADPPTPSAVADGCAVPLRSGCAELVSFAQSWHWFDVARTAPEIVRVLVPGGLWAAWWSHPRADGEEWFEALQALLERACPSYSRQHRNTGNRTWEDEPVGATGLFRTGRKVIVAWAREVSCHDWILETRSTSYVSALDPGAREILISAIDQVIAGGFPSGRMRVPYSTHVWMARAA